MSEIEEYAKAVLKTETHDTDYVFCYQLGASPWYTGRGARMLKEIEKSTGGQITNSVQPEGIFYFSKRISSADVIVAAFNRAA